MNQYIVVLNDSFLAQDGRNVVSEYPDAGVFNLRDAKKFAKVWDQHTTKFKGIWRKGEYGLQDSEPVVSPGFSCKTGIGSININC